MSSNTILHFDKTQYVTAGWYVDVLPRVGDFYSAHIVVHATRISGTIKAISWGIVLHNHIEDDTQHVVMTFEEDFKVEKL